LNLFNFGFGKSYKFKVKPSRTHPREEAEKRFALFIATLVCIGMFYLVGAGGWMLFVSMLAYVIVRLRLTHTR